MSAEDISQIQNSSKNTQNIIEITSPFLKHLPALKSKSRNVRKKIYKFLQSHHHSKIHKENTINLSQLIKDKLLPHGVHANIKDPETSSLRFLEKIEFQAGVDLHSMKTAASLQEREISGITHQVNPAFWTAPKRKPLEEIDQNQTGDKKRLFLTNENSEQGELSFQANFSPQISIFNSLNDLPFGKSKDQFQSLKLKENCSFMQMDNRCSNRSNSLFDEPVQTDPLDFI